MSCDHIRNEYDTSPCRHCADREDLRAALASERAARERAEKERDETRRLLSESGAEYEAVINYLHDEHGILTDADPLSGVRRFSEMWHEEMDRAEKAEKERDELLACTPLVSGRHQNAADRLLGEVMRHSTNEHGGSIGVVEVQNARGVVTSLVAEKEHALAQLARCMSMLKERADNHIAADGSPCPCPFCVDFRNLSSSASTIEAWIAERDARVFREGLEAAAKWVEIDYCNVTTTKQAKSLAGLIRQIDPAALKTAHPKAKEKS